MRAQGGFQHSVRPDRVGVEVEHREMEGREAAGSRRGGENGLELSKLMISRELIHVKRNLLVIRMDVAGLTQWGSSWRRERVCGRVAFERIVEICGKVKNPTLETATEGICR